MEEIKKFERLKVSQQEVLDKFYYKDGHLYFKMGSARIKERDVIKVGIIVLG